MRQNPTTDDPPSTGAEPTTPPTRTTARRWKRVWIVLPEAEYAALAEFAESDGTSRPLVARGFIVAGVRRRLRQERHAMRSRNA